jgi:hypothetical protein
VSYNRNATTLLVFRQSDGILGDFSFQILQLKAWDGCFCLRRVIGRLDFLQLVRLSNDFIELVIGQLSLESGQLFLFGL